MHSNASSLEWETPGASMCSGGSEGPVSTCVTGTLFPSSLSLGVPGFQVVLLHMLWFLNSQIHVPNCEWDLKVNLKRNKMKKYRHSWSVGADVSLQTEQTEAEAAPELTPLYGESECPVASSPLVVGRGLAFCEWNYMQLCFGVLCSLCKVTQCIMRPERQWNPVTQSQKNIWSFQADPLLFQVLEFKTILLNDYYKCIKG
jgi:hypothetical protein